MRKITACVLLALSVSGCVRDNGTASYNIITDDQYREALTNEQTRAR